MKKVLKRSLAVFLVVVMIIGTTPLCELFGLELSIVKELLPQKANAVTKSREIIASGDVCSKNYGYDCNGGHAWFTLYDDGEIVINGTGDMHGGGDGGYYYPWTTNAEYGNLIKKVTIEEGITGIGCFYGGYCPNITQVSLPDSTISINSSFCFTGISEILIPKNVKYIYNAFSECHNLKSIKVDSYNNYFSVDKSGVLFNKEKTTLVQFPAGDSRISYNVPQTVTEIEEYSFNGASNLVKVIFDRSIEKIGDEAFTGCESLADVYYTGSVSQWNSIEIGDWNDELLDATIHYNYVPKDKFYNLGEETYSFENFRDSHAKGHCFGMAVTSSAYHLNLLDVSYLGIESSEVNLLEDTVEVKKPICHYQEIQGTYKSQAYITTNEWSEAIECVKTNIGDNQGSIIIDTWIYDDYKDEWYGHSVNFLYYKNVNGQDRIYVYDNNYPNIETYYYQDSNGYIQQAPKSTFNVGIRIIHLIDTLGYMEFAGYFKPKRVIYAKGTNIRIDGVEGSPMTGYTGEETKYMFEIPDNVEQVTITPLVDNAEFEYLDETYSFGSIKEDTVGVFTLAESDDTSGDFTIENPDESPNLWEEIIVLINLILRFIFFPITVWFM